MRRGAVTLALAALVAAPLAAKPSKADRDAAERDRPLAWRDAVQLRDHPRLHGWRQAWLDGLAQARAGGAAAEVAAEGALLDPDTGENDPAAPDGAYRCRAIKLGRLAPSLPAFTRIAPVPCRIAGGHFEELAGAQRVNGALWRFDGVRLLLLGALAVGDEHGTMPYGRDNERDTIGFFERIGPHRWRLVIPRPSWEDLVTVIEVTPAG